MIKSDLLFEKDTENGTSCAKNRSEEKTMTSVPGKADKCLNALSDLLLKTQHEPGKLIISHTSAYVINRDYHKLKNKYGTKWTAQYFRSVAYLFDADKHKIVEYRYAGVVINDCNCYHFHAITDISFRRINPRVAFVTDVTHQFVDCLGE